MRRQDREITDWNEMVGVIDRCDVCRLALNDEGYPYILPLNFGAKVSENTVTLYFHGAMEGKKYELIARDNRVSFEMDCAHRLVSDREMAIAPWNMRVSLAEGGLRLCRRKRSWRR